MADVENDETEGRFVSVQRCEYLAATNHICKKDRLAVCRNERDGIRDKLPASVSASHAQARPGSAARFPKCQGKETG